MILKFKNRIALFNTIAVAVITALVFIAIYLVIKKTAYEHLDSEINLEKEEVLNTINCKLDSIIINKMPEWDEAEHHKVEVNPTFLQIVDAQGKLLFRSSNLLNDEFSYNPNNKIDLFYDSEISNQKIRIGEFPIKNERNKVIGQLTIAISQQQSFSILHNLIAVLLISFPIVLMVLFLASSFAASKAIEPVHQLIKTTSKISDKNLSTRLVLPQRKDELYELTKTINELLQRIEISLIQQKQFTSDASHEIRTPLAAIRGTLEVLIRKAREPQAYEEKINTILHQVDRLDALLEQLLQLARLESGTVYSITEKIDLKQLIQNLQIKWQQLAAEKEISIQSNISTTPLVKGDKFLVELILDNSVSNAIKYGKTKGNVFLTWTESISTLQIIDDGIGIAEHHLPYIFNRFYRTDESRSSIIKGHGLGLSIMKKLAEVQNIKISVQSEVGLGTTFSFQFPKA